MAQDIKGLTFRLLTEDDAQAMLDLENEMLLALPDPAWYYPSTLEEFHAVGREQSGYGFFDGERLCALAVCSQGEPRGALSYARKIGCAPENTWDFRDVMIAPDYRRRGLHKAFLAFFESAARAGGAAYMYCTIDPGNAPSVSSFTKDGFTLVTIQPAYDGRIRGYYRKAL